MSHESPGTETENAGRTGAYLRFELMRAWRNRRFLFFSLAFPLIMFYLIATPNKDEVYLGISLPAYFMAGMLAWGTMSAVMASGARISLDRASGWQRQLRITPLPVTTYFTAKVLSGYLLAIVSLAAMLVAGATLGVRLGWTGILQTTGLVLLFLVPFAVLGVLIGHLLSPDTMGPALGGLSAPLAVLGGAWGQLASRDGPTTSPGSCRPTGSCKPVRRPFVRWSCPSRRGWSCLGGR